MALLSYKITATIFIFIITLLAIIYPIKSRARPTHNRSLELADAFASGIFLGTALFHMLPDAIKFFSTSSVTHSLPIAEFFCATGFLFLLFIDRLANYFTIAQKNSADLTSYMIAIILIIHAFIEGAVLGINTFFPTAFVIFIAIIAHKGSESFALAITLNRSSFSLTKIMGLIILFSLMTPLGVVLGTTLTTTLAVYQNALFTAIFNAFAAGTFLYMSTLHHINHHQRQHEKENLFEFVALLIGLMIMGMLAYWA